MHGLKITLSQYAARVVVEGEPLIELTLDATPLDLVAAIGPEPFLDAIGKAEAMSYFGLVDPPASPEKGGE